MMSHWKTWMVCLAGMLIAGPGLAETLDPTLARGERPAQGEAMPAQPEPAGQEPGHDTRAGAAPADEEYVVQEGETLAEIAEKKLGSAEQWQVLARANGISDPEKLRAGQKLRIPADGRS